MFRVVLAIAACLVSAGCVFVGHDFDGSRLVELQPEFTTTDEAAAILGGGPNQQATLSNGNLKVTWLRNAFWPGLVDEYKRADIIFGPDRRLQRIEILVNIPMSEIERRRFGVSDYLPHSVRTLSP